MKNARGYTVTIEWPPLEELRWAPAELVSLRDEDLGIRERMREVGERVQRLHEMQGEPERADTLAYAEAMRAGKPDPGPVNIERWRRESEQARRELEALDLALDQITDAVLAAIRAHPEWLEELAALVEKARRAEAAALEKYEAARHQRDALASTALWLANFEDRPVYRPAGRMVLPGLRGPSGEAPLVGDVFAALRAAAAPPEPKRPADEVPAPDEPVEV